MRGNETVVVFFFSETNMKNRKLSNNTCFLDALRHTSTCKLPKSLDENSTACLSEKLSVRSQCIATIQKTSPTAVNSQFVIHFKLDSHKATVQCHNKLCLGWLLCYYRLLIKRNLSNDLGSHVAGGGDSLHSNGPPQSVRKVPTQRIQKFRYIGGGGAT